MKREEGDWKMNRRTAFSRARQGRQRREFWANVGAGVLCAFMVLSVAGVFVVAALMRVSTY